MGTHGKTYGAVRHLHVTFPSLASTPDSGDVQRVAGADSSSDPIERDIIDILKRLSRRPINPTTDSELLADLGFDSLQVLELVGELEDHFNIAVPLNALTHIKSVGQVAVAVRQLVAGAGARS